MVQLTRPCNPGEVGQLRSVIGALSWATRVCKPELLYRVSQLQTVISHARVHHLREANRVLSDAFMTAGDGITFQEGAVKWDDEVITLAVTDASWAGENHDARGEMEPLHSQRARKIGLAGPGLVSGDKDLVHPICFASNTIRRLCESTLQAETLALWGASKLACASAQRLSKREDTSVMAASYPMNGKHLPLPT